MSKQEKKILLNSEGLFNQTNEDLFLDIELNCNFSEIRPEVYNNNFDLQKEFENERNTSRNFVLYGMIDSIVRIDSNNFLELWKQIIPPSKNIENPQIQTYSEKNLIVLNDGSTLQYVQLINTSLLKYTTGNILDIQTRKYYIELNNYYNTDQHVVYLFVNSEKVKSTSNNYFVRNQLFKQELVFFDTDGNFIPYGTEDEFINNDGTTFSVNNNFPFFYNKHWVKNNITINRAYTSKVSFEVDTVKIKEGQTINVNVVLDKPTLQTCSIVLQYLNLTATQDDYTILQNTLTFNKGTKNASLSIKANIDSNVEVSEKFKISMSQFFECEIGAISELEVTILKTEITNFVNYNLQNLYKNLLSFGENNLNNSVLFSNLRDGYFVGDLDSKSFFPNDDYVISIKNLGIDTLFSTNDILNNEIIFKSGETLSFQYINSYSGNSTQSLGIKINISPFSQYSAIVNINGIIYTNIKTNQDLITKLNNDNNIKYYIYSLEQILDADGNIFEEYVLLRSTTPGLPIIVKNLETNITPVEFGIMSGVDSRFTNYIPYSSIPPNIKLFSNSKDGNFCNYEFTIKKQGYKDINISSTSLLANNSGNTYYLVTGYRDINSAYKDEECLNPGELSNFINLSTVYVNGLLFNFNSNNLTDTIYSKFLPKPINVIDCTKQNNIGGFNILI